MRPLLPLPEWIELEHQVAKILSDQEIHGWQFDENAARELECSLRKELWDLEDLLRKRFPYVAGAEFTPKRANKTSGYVPGATFTKLKDLNPFSRDHIAWILKTHCGWTPSLTTSTGKAVIDEVILKEIGTELALKFLRGLTINKILGMISEGANAWLKLCTKSRIHHSCSTTTITHRCSHRRPNLAQVPSEEQYRKLFIATPGNVLVGADLSGIELRMLAHYLAKYDQGRYAKILLEGDIHQVNADAIGISRKQVKTVTYAFLYGAGQERIGHAFDPQLSTKQAKKKGKEIAEAYVAAIPGLGQLLEAVKAKGETGKVKAIDGRPIIVGSPHKSLNCLLQASAAVIAKRWMVITHEINKEVGIKAQQLAFIHDELQFESTPEHATDLQASLVQASLRSGEHYGLRIRIDCDTNTGRSWADTH